MKLRHIFAVSSGLVAFLTFAVAFGQDAPGQPPTQPTFGKSVDNAVKEGCEYLKSMQLPDGSWHYIDEPFQSDLVGVESHLVEGCTALCLYALLKGGENPKSPAIEKGFAFIRSRPFRHVYSVSCYVLALSALYTEEEPQEKPPEEASEAENLRTVLKEDAAAEFKRRATPQDKKLMTDAIEWLLRHQQANIWRYPMHGEDASNTQYVMLAFNEARRLGIPVPLSSCMKVVEYFIKNQEKSGPEVEWFSVPAADLPFKEIRKVERELKKEIGKIEKELEKDKDESRADAITITVIEDARRRIFSGERNRMFARGWCYIPNDPENQEWHKEITGSMTTSGIIALTVCKSILEGTSKYTADIAAKVDKGIRDGCGWLAQKFTVATNPTGSGKQYIHHYYYLYGLERAGVLTLTRNFGTRDWYKEGVELILAQQEPDGKWYSAQGTSGPVVDTCFAILFLRSARTPVVNLPPPPVYTGRQPPEPRKVRICAHAEGRKVRVRAHTQSAPLMNVQIFVYAPDGAKILEAKTDENGECVFVALFCADLRIELNAVESHSTNYILKAEELPADLPEYEEWKNLRERNKIGRIVESVVESKIAPLEKKMMTGQQPSQTASYDRLIAALGIIFGVMGLIMYLRSLRRGRPRTEARG
jgi:hypothetical protein